MRRRREECDLCTSRRLFGRHNQMPQIRTFDESIGAAAHHDSRIRIPDENGTSREIPLRCGFKRKWEDHVSYDDRIICVVWARWKFDLMSSVPSWAPESKWLRKVPTAGGPRPYWSRLDSRVWKRRGMANGHWLLFSFTEFAHFQEYKKVWKILSAMNGIEFFLIRKENKKKKI